MKDEDTVLRAIHACSSSDYIAKTRASQTNGRGLNDWRSNADYSWKISIHK
jgi:hypothetical protein